jgi:hypothetical protein
MGSVLRFWMALWWSFQRSISSISSVFYTIRLMKQGNGYYRMLEIEGILVYILILLREQYMYI